ncbi:hypothetical protein E1H13_19155 [Nodosilinea sp. P-1105]|nr:hypothetical protein [Nodosilinea sp. P-1105]
MAMPWTASWPFLRPLGRRSRGRWGGGGSGEVGEVGRWGKWGRWGDGEGGEMGKVGRWGRWGDGESKELRAEPVRSSRNGREVSFFSFLFSVFKSVGADRCVCPAAEYYSSKSRLRTAPRSALVASRA